MGDGEWEWVGLEKVRWGGWIREKIEDGLDWKGRREKDW